MINVDTTGFDLNNSQSVALRRLFEAILKIAMNDHIKGNIIIPFDGAGNYGQLRVESWFNLDAKGR